MAKSKPASKMKSKKPAPKKAAAKGKPAMKAKAKKPSKPAPAKKGLLKKLTGKAMAALSKADKERMKRDAAKAKEAEKKAAAKEKAELAKEKEREKREAMKAKADAAKAKDAEKKAAIKAKLDAAKAKDAEKKAAIKAKADAIKEKERAKKDGEKAKILAAKEAEKAKKVSDKEAAKQAKIQAKIDEKAAKKAEKELAKRRARGEDVDDEGMVARPRGGDEDDDEADFKRVAAKGGKKSRGDEETISKYGDVDGRNAADLAELREQFAWPDIAAGIINLEFFIDAKDDSCVEKGCDNIRTTLSWCRLHYLKNWKGIQRKKEILAEGKLQEYIEELISKYPAKYVDAIMKDLGDDKDFYKVLNELNITNEFDFEEEDFEADSDNDGDDDIGIEQTFTGSMRYEDTE